MSSIAVSIPEPFLSEFCSRWRIRRLSVFGSALRNDFGPLSDIDLLAEFDEDTEWDGFDHLDMEEQLGGVTGRAVDLVNMTAVQSSRNLLAKSEILSSAKQIYARG